ncbi:MAG: helix-turn-helix domain-containing protein [Paramuribaculum sp.]|nr:helix-turn-helix domain-containing protein [Paramuribaculum sp.]
MATSTIRIKKVCEWCGKEFEAQKCSTRYCCKRCAEHAYKDRKRQERKTETETRVIETIIRQKEEAVSRRDYLSVQETADLMGVKRNAVYQQIYRGKLKAFRITSRITRIRRTDIDELLHTSCYVRQSKAKSSVNDENGETISEFYTTKEIIEKFGVSNSWVFAQGKAHNIPKVYHRGKTLWSKTHCDRVFTAKPEAPKEDDWISYSDVRAEYNLTHDQLHNYVKYHGLRRKKVGKYTYILKSEIDAILRPPTLK